MKLYATSTNARTSKGIGDADKIEILLKYGNQITGILTYCLKNGEPQLDYQQTVDKRKWLIPIIR